MPNEGVGVSWILVRLIKWFIAYCFVGDWYRLVLVTVLIVVGELFLAGGVVSVFGQHFSVVASGVRLLGVVSWVPVDFVVGMVLVVGGVVLYLRGGTVVIEL